MIETNFNNLNDIADEKFVSEHCKELLELIESVEKQYNTVLVGDRCDLETKPQKDMVGKITKAQVELIFSEWRKGIICRYVK